MSQSRTPGGSRHVRPMDSTQGRGFLRAIPDSIVPAAPRFRAACGSGSSSATAQVILPTLAAAARDPLARGLRCDGRVRAVVFAPGDPVVSRLLRDFPYPLRLLPASRIAVALLPVARRRASPSALSSSPRTTRSCRRLLLAAAVAAPSSRSPSRFRRPGPRRRPLRIAVLGAADFVPAIRRELDAIGGRREIEVIGWLNLGGRYAADGAPPSSRRSTASARRSPSTKSTAGPRPGPGSSRSGRDVYDTIAAGCLDLPVRMIDGNQLYEQVFGHVPIGTIDSAWFLFLMHPRFQASSKYSKRAFDLWSGPRGGRRPAARRARRDRDQARRRWPIFYRQTRVGERGREFEILKLRTMRDGRRRRRRAVVGGRR